MVKCTGTLHLKAHAPAGNHFLKENGAGGASHLRRDFDFTENPEEAEQKFS
jgi:hypothetical protein